MAKQAKDERLNQQATFVFRGTVRKLRAATIASVPVTEKTIVVRVDEVLRGPEVLAQYDGTDITVQLGSREQAAKDEQAIFYTNSWLVGESLAVTSVGHTAVARPAVSGRAAAGRSNMAGGGQADRGLQEELANADTVVTGKVTSVRVVDEQAGGAGGDLTAADRFQPISEHSPAWQEAVIEVADVEKGTDIPREIVVRFPSSTDVRWYDAPKFRPGQEGVFLLQKESQKRSAPARRTRAGAASAGQDAAGAKVYTALGSAAIQPIQKVETIRTLIKAAK
ncbi:MAG TPA: hypothetical protein VF723_04355 [Pyrinomonadaceae bacterium]|jgi:hypothetical protein